MLANRKVPWVRPSASYSPFPKGQERQYCFLLEVSWYLVLLFHSNPFENSSSKWLCNSILKKDAGTILHDIVDQITCLWTAWLVEMLHFQSGDLAITQNKLLWGKIVWISLERSNCFPLLLSLAIPSATGVDALNELEIDYVVQYLLT